jgi:LuxR family maltose regulon positive regulatory protein
VMERQCYRSALRLGLELASLFYLRDDMSAARQHVHEAIRIAAPHRFVRSFIDAGAEIRHLLRALVTADHVAAGELEFALQVLRGCTSEKAWVEPGNQALTARVQAGEFTHREVDILELAAGDVPNREIARRLVLSEHTVKWYWKQIFGKLNVHRRLQAVITARAAGLIH